VLYVCVSMIVYTRGQEQLCGYNEELIQCAHPDPTCARPFPNFCPLVCDPPACRCRRGHARNAFGYCVPFRQCPRPLRAEIVVRKLQIESSLTANPLLAPCPRHERFVECSTPEGTCNDPQARALPIGHPKCQCLEGYVRHEGRCVNECPTRLQPIEELSRGNVEAEDGSASTTTTTVNAPTLVADEEGTNEPSSALESAVTDNAEQEKQIVPVVSEPEISVPTPPNVPVNPEAQEVVPVATDQPETDE
ncbi:SWM-1 protein, partial [Aphelenchoides avenae]